MQGGIFDICFGRSGDVSTLDPPDENDRPLIPVFFFLTILAMMDSLVEFYAVFLMSKRPTKKRDFLYFFRRT
jgi:hypothetical protein